MKNRTLCEERVISHQKLEAPNLLLILDRDGVVNNLVGPNFSSSPRNIEDFQLKTGFEEIQSFVSKHQINVAIVTNQPDLARGFLSLETNESIKLQVISLFSSAINYIECSHDNNSGCSCRKPLPGMLLKAMEGANVSNPQFAVMVGDKWTDVIAAEKAGIKSILLENEHSYSQTSAGKCPNDISPDFTANNFEEVIEALRLYWNDYLVIPFE